jgi:hypothetical protein
MRTARVLLAALCMLVVSAPVIAGEAADADIEVLRDSIRANKKALVAVNLALSDDEAKAFWPVYDRYEGELKAVNDRLLKVIDDYMANYKGLTDEKATTIVTDYLAVEEDRAKLRRNYLPEFAKALPGRKVARLYQIENKMDAVLRYDLAEEIPVAE